MEMIRNLEKINAKLRQVVVKTKELEQLNKQLTNENKKLHARLDSQNEEETTEQHKLKRLSEDQNEEGRTQSVVDQDIRQQIDQYLEEIDQCIEWLKQQ